MKKLKFKTWDEITRGAGWFEPVCAVILLVMTGLLWMGPERPETPAQLVAGGLLTVLLGLLAAWFTAVSVSARLRDRDARRDRE